MFLLLTSQSDPNAHRDETICRSEQHPLYALLHIRGWLSRGPDKLTMTISPETCRLHDSKMNGNNAYLERMNRPCLRMHIDTDTMTHTIPFRHISQHLTKAVSCKCGSIRLHADLPLARYPMFCTDPVRRSEGWRNSLRSAVGNRRKWNESACPCSPRRDVSS